MSGRAAEDGLDGMNREVGMHGDGGVGARTPSPLWPPGLPLALQVSSSL